MKNKAIYYNVMDLKAPEIIDFKDDLQFFYKLIKCEMIDITSRFINGKRYNIICDDLGALKKDRKTTIMDFMSNVQTRIFGNFILVGETDKEGNLTALSEKECKEIMESRFLKLSFLIDGEKSEDRDVLFIDVMR